MSPKNKHAVALGRLGGAATKGVSTPAKRKAARANGRKNAPRPNPSPVALAQRRHRAKKKATADDESQAR